MWNRQIAPLLAQAMLDTPVILLNGARQTGKSTLLQHVAADLDCAYFTLDDPETFAAAKSNPHGFIAANAGRLLIDEVQRVPDLFLAIKHAVDTDRKPGRFLLTGSANVLLIPRLSESLAGRMEIVTLRPLAQSEMRAAPSSQNWVDAWFSRDALTGTSQAKYKPVDREQFLLRLLVGGYPEATTRVSSKRRTAWFSNYLQTVLQRDVRDLAQIEGLTQLPQLLSAIAQKTTGSLNVADISRTLGIPQTSLKRYLTLLETVYLIEPVPAWTHRDSQRAQKAANYYLNDSGLFAHVMGMTEKSQAASHIAPLISLNGALVETFVQSELRKQLSWSDTSAQLLHYRTSTGIEVDFVIEDKAGNVVGIEVKSSLTVSNNDFKGLRHMRELLGGKFIRGIVLHPGDNVVQWDTELSSIPMSCFY
jgi:hypothetical protein